MKWEPQDVLRLVALIGGFVTFVLGAVMMWSGISAEGAIDIRSSIVSGSIKTASAGLFIVFLSFFVIVFSIIRVMRDDKRANQAHPTEKTYTKTLKTIFFALLTLLVLSVALASVGYPLFIVLAGFLGFVTFFCVLVIFFGYDN